MPKRIIVDENGLVVAVESAPKWMAMPSSMGNTGGKTGTKKRYKSTPNFKWVPSTGPTVATEYSASAVARRRAEERRRRAKEKEARQVRAAAWARRQTEEELRAMERLTDFEEAYALSVARKVQ